MEKMKSKFDQDRQKEAEVAKEIFSWRYENESTIENHRFDNMFDRYLQLHLPDIEKWIDTIFEKQKENKKDYCDIDWGITIVMNTDSKRVLFVDNYVTCADITKFLVIQDVRKNYKKTTHLRLVWDDDATDYKGTNQYISRPSFKWYEDRGFDLNFKQEWHMTKLGGSYADCRDAGFLMTFSKEFDFDLPEDKKSDDPKIQDLIDTLRKHKENYGDYLLEKGSLYHYGELKSKLWDLSGAFIQLNEEENENKNE